MKKTRILIVLGFVGTIAAGAFLLMLPASSPSGAWMKPMDALFTSCSAVCITGLSVIDAGADLSRFGQCVLIALVQIGCVGMMTLGTFFLVVVGRRLSLSSEFSLMNAYGAKGVNGWRGLVMWVILSMAAIELAGTWALRAVHPALTLFEAYFYSVMSFCNSGFSLDAASLAPFGKSPSALIVMGLLSVLGGLGFLVNYNICTIQFWRRNLVKRGRLSLHSHVVLVMTLALLAGMFAFFLAMEWNGVLKPFSAGDKAAVAFFQSISLRSCGFTVTPMEDLHPATRFVSEVLMFVGAAPGSAGGGIKVTTVAVFLVTILAFCRGRRDTVVFRRTVPEAVVRESIVIVMVFAAMIVLGMTALLISDGGEGGLPFEHLLFETVSAVSTTGLSCAGTTASLSNAGRVVIMLCMLCGRLGALTVVMLVGGQEESSTIRYPKEELVVG